VIRPITFSSARAGRLDTALRGDFFITGFVLDFAAALRGAGFLAFTGFFALSGFLAFTGFFFRDFTIAPIARSDLYLDQ